MWAPFYSLFWGFCGPFCLKTWSWVLSHVWIFATPWTAKILQARILEWVAIPFSRESSLPQNWTLVSLTAGRFFTIWAIVESHIVLSPEEYFCPFHFPNSFSGIPISQMLRFLDKSFMFHNFIRHSILISFSSTIWRFSWLYKSNFEFTFNFGSSLFTLQELCYLCSNSCFSWLRHLRKLLCRYFENYCLLPVLALFPLDPTLPFIYLTLSVWLLA